MVTAAPVGPSPAAEPEAPQDFRMVLAQKVRLQCSSIQAESLVPACWSQCAAAAPCAAMDSAAVALSWSLHNS